MIGACCFQGNGYRYKMLGSILSESMAKAYILTHLYAQDQGSYQFLVEYFGEGGPSGCRGGGSEISFLHGKNARLPVFQCVLIIQQHRL